jgi:hypothetical protein
MFTAAFRVKEEIPQGQIADISLVIDAISHYLDFEEEYTVTITPGGVTALVDPPISPPVEDEWEPEHSHSFQDATCTTPKTCTSCGAVEGEPLGHDYSARTTVYPTCTKKGIKTFTCKGCGDSYTEDIPALGHNFDAGKVTKKATCKSTGVKTYTCEDCGDIKTETIAKSKTHLYDNDCDTTCNRCSKTRTVTHDYKTTTTKATFSKNGKIVKKCGDCGKVASTTTILYVKTVNLSYTSYTYNGKVKTPAVTVKNSAGKVLTKNTDYTVTYSKDRTKVGTYKVTVQLKGKYSGTKTLTFKIVPAKTTVSKLTAGSKKITVSINKKTTQITGYQVQYSTSKTFTNANSKTITSYKTTKVTLSDLRANKTYYVRVRTYKTVNGVRYYSGWSDYKYVKTKK